MNYMYYLLGSSAYKSIWARSENYHFSSMKDISAKPDIVFDLNKCNSARNMR